MSDSGSERRSHAFAVAIAAVVFGCSAHEDSTAEGTTESDVANASTIGTARAAVQSCNDGVKNTAPLPVVDYAAAVLADGPVGYWRLGERTGTAAADSNALGAANSGTYINSPWLDYPGAVTSDRDGAPFLNYAQKAYVEVPNNGAQQITGDLSVEAWFTIPGTATKSGLLVKTAPNQDMVDGYGFYWEPYRLRFFVSNTSFTVSVPMAAEPSQSRFHHVVGTYNKAASRLTLYLDGVRVDQKTRATPNVAIVPGSGPLRIGRNYTTNLNWHGSVDEAAIYATELDLARVRAHYHAGLGDSPFPERTPTGTGTTGTYARQVAVSMSASDGALATAKDLAAILDQIEPSSTPFVPQKTSSPMEDAIRLIRHGDPSYVPTAGAEQNMNNLLAERDVLSFFAFSDPAAPGLRIVGKSDGALRAGASFYMRLLGARFLLPDMRPTPRWTLLPARASVRWNVARLESPDFKWAGAFFGTGDWGATFTPELVLQSLVPTSPPTTTATTWKVWQTRNMFVEGASGFTVGGQMGEAFNSAHLFREGFWTSDQRDTLGDDCRSGVPLAQLPVHCNGQYTSHPEWRAHVPGPGGVLQPVTLAPDWTTRVKFNWRIHGNPEFKTYFANRMLQDLTAYVNLDPGGINSQAVSTERFDGGTPDTLPAGVTQTDTAIELANAMAAAIASAYPSPTRYATFLAYGDHSALPSAGVTVSPNVVTVVDADEFNWSGLTHDALYTAWSQRSPNLAAYTVLSPTRNMLGNLLGRIPVVDPFVTIPKRIRHWRNLNLFEVLGQSTYGTGVSGFAWALIPQMLWNSRVLDDDLLAANINMAFGLGAPKMTALFRRWSTLGATLQPNELGISLGLISEALTAAASDPDPGVLQRVTDFAAFVHYMVLAYECNAAGRIPSAPATAALGAFLWKTHDRQIVQAADIWKWQIGSPAVTWDGTFMCDAEVRALVANDLSRYQTIVSPPAYSLPVIPVGPAPVGDGDYRASSQSYFAKDSVTFYLHAQTGGPGTSLSFDLRNKGQIGYGNVPVRATVTAPDGTLVLNQRFDSPNQWDPVQPVWWHRDVTFNTPVPGTYTLFIRSELPAGATIVAVAKRIPFAASCDHYIAQEATDTDPTPPGAPGSYWPTSYFYVPPGTTRFALYGSLNTGATICPPSGCSAPGRSIPVNSGNTVIDVLGQSGIWSISAYRGQLTFIGVPGLVSPSPSQVLTFTTVP